MRFHTVLIRLIIVVIVVVVADSTKVNSILTLKVKATDAVDSALSVLTDLK